MTKIKYIPIVSAVMVVLFIYKQWFLPSLLSGGDATYVYRMAYSDFSLFPLAWQEGVNNGYGGYAVPFLTSFPMDIPIVLFGKYLHFSWDVIQRMRLFYPFIILGISSSLIVFRKLFPKNDFYFLTPILFLCNTYILMLVGGGQLLLGLAYACIPVLFFLAYMITIQKKSFMYLIVLEGIFFALQMVFDLRITYITFGLVIFFWIFHNLIVHETLLIRIRSFMKVIIVPACIVGLIHAYWIIPALVIHQNTFAQLGSAYSSQSAVQFFSFATFENAISLLQPNWPSNTFGITGFMRPEYLIYPLIGFSPLLYISKKKKKESELVLFMMIIILLASFLAKGSNEPFGVLYLWAFQHVPGFILFRDPTKWYTLIAVGYSFLIPYAINEIYNFLMREKPYEK